jgi:hypothetical protein
MIVRQASLPDLSEIVAWGGTQHHKAGDGTTFSAPWFRNSVKAAMQDPQQCVLVAKRGGKVCGLLMGAAYPCLWAPSLRATDTLFTADAGGAELVDAFFAWCDRMKVKRIDMGVSTADDPATDRFYRMQDMTRAGGMYFRNLGVSP